MYVFGSGRLAEFTIRDEDSVTVVELCGAI